jgi:putative transposase
LTDNVGPVQIEVRQDRDGSFDPVIVREGVTPRRRLPPSCCRWSSKGLTAGEVSAHFEHYGASLSKDTISRIADRVLTEMSD